MRTRRWIAVACVLAATTWGSSVAGPAHADRDFYRLPAAAPSSVEAGHVLRTETFRVRTAFPPPPGQPLPPTATRLMYRSTDSHGRANIVTGTYLEPTTRWAGGGSRPVVAFAPGTHGQGDQCAPSRLWGQPVHYLPPTDLALEYETSTVAALLARGYAVVETDYEGLGTSVPHTYVNRLAEAHAVLDSVRAARRLPASSIDERSPVGLWGYSQGGGASAAAAELAPQYAPELTIAGAFVGAPPADLARTLAGIDGSGLTGAIGYTINGLAYSNPELTPVIDAHTNAVGKAALRAVARQCTAETVARFGFHSTREWTTSGESLSAILGRLPDVVRVLDANRIGRLRPAVPVYVYTNKTDDFVASGQVVTLAHDWCAMGANTRLVVDDLPVVAPGAGLGHIVPDLLETERAADWMADRMRGASAVSNC